MKYRLSRNVVLLGLVSFFNDFSSEMILSIFPAFFTSVLKAGAASLGLVEGIADGASNIIKIYSGRWSDRIQKRKPFMFAGYFLSVAIRPFYILFQSVGGVVGLRFIDRVGKGLREGPRDAIISLSAEQGQLGRSFGYHRAMDTAGALLGPLVAYFILRNNPLHFDTVFITAFIIGLCAVGTIFFVSDVVGKIQSKKITLGSFQKYSPAFKQYLVALFILSLGCVPMAVMLLKTQNIGLSLASIPLFYMLYNLSYIIFSVLGGYASDKIGPKKVIIAGYIFLVIGYIFISLAHTILLLVISFLILGLFPALTDGVQRAYVGTLTNEYERAGAYGLMNAVTGFGFLGAGIVGGYAWQHFGSTIALLGAGVLVVVGIVIMITISLRVHKKV